MSGFLGNAGLTLYQMAFEISPIILTGGIASLMGGMLPIMILTESLNFAGGLLAGTDPLDVSQALCHFRPLPGASLISYRYGKYPFFNRATAANAAIKQPRTVSLHMTAPAKGPGGMLIKTATFIAMQATLDYHQQKGGTYTVMTPNQIYTNCLLNEITDATQGGTGQTQVDWVWNFEQPNLTQEDLASVQSNVMQLLGNGGQISGAPSWSGSLTGIGSSLGLPTPGLIPGAGSVAGGGIAPVPGIGSVPQ